MDDKRFVIVNEQAGFGTEVLILIDKETGVQYLYYRNGAGGGMTVLVDENGKPLINKNI